MPTAVERPAPVAERRPSWSTPPATKAPLLQTPDKKRRFCRPVADIARAGSLLASPPLPTSFQDEEDMRRVYALIYDVFRYKSVMDQALVDVHFFTLRPDLRRHRSQLWLLLFDLWQRDFNARKVQDEESRQLLEKAGLIPLEEALWEARIRLAAAIARMRIKHQALRLEQLLPPHLRDDRMVAIDMAFVTAWINPFRAGDTPPLKLLDSVGLQPLTAGKTRLTPDTFAVDHMCPRVILCHPMRRAELAQSHLVKEHKLILQDRTFCVGPSAMARLLHRMELRGCVAQTHVNSARTTAYLAALLHSNDKVDKLLAFGAGSRKEEYERYLRDLGVKNAVIHAESFVEAAAASNASMTSVTSDVESGDEEPVESIRPADNGPLAGVAAVLATPPNTYSGVSDPVDLVCSRGGDLAMLEVLTDTDADTLARSRVASILDEQRQTLLRAMSRPQIQVVLYETHSIVSAENSDMVSRLVREVNYAALERHAEEKGRTLPSGFKLSPEIYEELKIPPCDLFEVSSLPEMCGHEDECLNFDGEGCYLAVLQRKEVVRLDNKYMIDIAESRGLFGVPAGAKKSAASRARRRELAQGSGSLGRASGKQSKKSSSRRSSFELERIAAHTQASLQRSVWWEADDSCGCCPRHAAHLQETKEHSNKLGDTIQRLKREDKEEKSTDTSTHIQRFKEKASNQNTKNIVEQKKCLTLQEHSSIITRLCTPTEASLRRQTTRWNSKLLHLYRTFG